MNSLDHYLCCDGSEKGAGMVGSENRSGKGTEVLGHDKCTRCGLGGNLLDLDTGSVCHPELRDCIHALRTRVKVLEAQAANMADDFLDIQGQAIRYLEELDRVQAELARYRDAVNALTPEEWITISDCASTFDERLDHEFGPIVRRALRRIAKLVEEER